MKNNIFTRNLKNKGIALAVCAVVYLGLQILSMTLLNSVYIFEWMSRNFYCYTWVLALAMIVFDKTVPAYFVTFGNLIGTVTGQILGDIIREVKLNNITPDMTELDISIIEYTHHGVTIWGIILFASIVLGIIAEIIINSKKRKKLAAA